MADYTVKALTPATWDDFAGLAARHNGVWGGCWCMAFHGGFAKDAGAAGNRAAKVGLVRAGRAHAALVYAGGDVSDGASSGSLRTCPGSRIARHKRRCKAGCRITCVFVDKGWRGRGVAAAALTEALAVIAKAGGGHVESFPEEVAGRKPAAAFLHNAEAVRFDRAGFDRVRKLGKARWSVERAVLPDHS